METVVIDTDMNFDDAMAILYLLNRADVNVTAITVTGTGLAHLAPGSNNALRLLELAEAPREIRVAAGADEALVYQHVDALPADWRCDADTLLGLADSLPETTRQLDPQSAEDVLREEVEQHKPVTIVALGPHTNLANTLNRYPAIAAGIDRIVVMGGAVRVDGNIGYYVQGNSSAEWNIYLDPVAAKRVFDSRIPITLVPLDATNAALITNTFCNDFKEAASKSRRPCAKFVDAGFDVLRAPDRKWIQDWYCFWDPLAAAIAIDRDLASIGTVPLDVVTAEGDRCGQTREERSGSPVDVTFAAKVGEFESRFTQALNS